MSSVFFIDFKTNANTIISGRNSEKAFIHTDRNIYIAGENIFFKLYIINESTNKLSEISRIAYLMLRNKSNEPIVKFRLKVEEGTSYGSIFLPDTLSSGPYLLTVFTNWMRNSDEESYFNKEIFIANRFDTELSAISRFSGSTHQSKDSILACLKGNISLNVIPDKTEYKKRSKISLTLKFPDNAYRLMANISISVFEEVPGMDNSRFGENYLSLKTDSSQYARHPGHENWKFLPEVKGEIIQGKITDQATHKALTNTCVFLSAKDSVVNLQYNFTDTNGLFRFLLNDYYDRKDLIFSVKSNPVTNKIKIEPEDKFKLKHSFSPLVYQENLDLKEYILKSQDIVTIQKIYQMAYSLDLKKPFISNIICPKIYFKSSYIVKPGDFMPLNDLLDMSREIIPPQLKIRKHEGKYYANMADENQHKYLEQEPAIFLDGILINDINQIINFGSDKIKRLELVCARFNYGELILPGILAVFSKKPEIANMQAFPVSLHFQLEAYHPYSVFSSPTYTGESSDHKPDFRQLLYWNPYIEISNEQIQIPEFYASDHSGNYLISIEGISSDGLPVCAFAKFKVK